MQEERKTGEIVVIGGHDAKKLSGPLAVGEALQLSGLDKRQYIAATVNWEEKDFSMPLLRDEHYRIEGIRTQSVQGMKIYARSLILVVLAAMAEYDIEPQRLIVKNPLDSSLYCQLEALETKDILLIETKMKQIVAEAWPIKRLVMKREKAMVLFEGQGLAERLPLLEQLDRETVSVYQCGKALDYLFGVMAPHAGYLGRFSLEPYRDGVLIRYPQPENLSVLPAFHAQPGLTKIFREADEWGKVIGCASIARLNRLIDHGGIEDVVRVAEALHEKKLAQTADFITMHRNEARVILIAGPSSSGKTTFAQRLSVQLKVNGVQPVPISLDDYFLDREQTPRKPDGGHDFESIRALDLDLLNEHLEALLAGDAVKVPRYNFMTGQREYRGQTICVRDDQPLILEGIHGLNDLLTAGVPAWKKIKIYISALTQLTLDEHNRIPTTDVRLLRRIVRDSQFRAHDALQTLRMWDNVRAGEERNIFPFQESADVMFNTALIYELAVLKKYAVPLLEAIGPDVPEYGEAHRLLNFLLHVRSMPDEPIPPNSILREFIGNSWFVS